MATVAPPLRIGPADDGRMMSLEEFRETEELDEYRYELARGVLEVTDVPNDSHCVVVCNLYHAISRRLRASVSTRGSCFRPASAAPRSTSCNGTSACGPARHSAGSDDTCSDATCSSGDAGQRRTSLAGRNRTDEGTSDWPSSPDGESADCAESRLISVIDHQRLRPERRLDLRGS